ncbi:Glutamate-ammonia-ligase adenylyltransferase [hydrothermal vent metagenome]|uniref:Glutamate-ammonia-ligase adenylyltransferase n=1 Tax=hydrothermal vent metagenome TaxID=652676 RepID=A0A3B0ZWL7_9ZZZZ
MFNKAIQNLPSQLQDSVLPLLDELASKNIVFDKAVPAAIQSSLAIVWAVSQFVSQNCLRDGNLLKELIDSGDLLIDYHDIDDFKSRLIRQVTECHNEQQLMQVLRQFRQREMIRIVWRDISGWADLTQVLLELSLLADCCINFAVDTLFSWQCNELGIPVDENGKTQSLLVVGMGKLGAYELNFSSDIDLIFVYESAGKTHKTNTSNAEFFIQLGRQLIRVLDQKTADGFVFRVDMRLRPFGESGSLAINFNAMEHYYQAHGREWERYAWIKARVIAGNSHSAAELQALLNPFIYRRYIDYGVFESLREMKQLIVNQNKRKGMDNNIKLGSGGIREIEFIGQVFQLIRGGRETDLQQRSIMAILSLLANKEYLPKYATKQLLQAYDFLRRVENRLQAFADQQTHQLPNDNLDQCRLAVSMGFDNYRLFESELNAHRRNVQQQFEQVFVAPQTEPSANDNAELLSVWLDQSENLITEKHLHSAGYHDVSEVIRQLKLLLESRLVRSLSVIARRRLDKLMPLLIAAAGQTENSNETLKRVISVIEQVVQRSVYLSLLIENPMALSQFVQLCSASPWITRYLARHPVLLDELIDPRSLLALPDKQMLAQELRQKIKTQGISDIEQSMNILRHFKQSNELRIAAADISQTVTLLQVSDYLSWIADVLLDMAFEIAWQELVQKYGRPVCSSDGNLCERGFAIIAYGKLGGLELGYGSDLDLVFLHAAEPDLALSNDGQALSSTEFFIRLGQRIIQLLTVATAAGVAYEVDMRLRPNGASGFLVSSISAYSDYQLNKAWTWEHQALVRARVVCGDPLITDKFNDIRQQVLSQTRQNSSLKQQVQEMRDKMKQNSRVKAPQFDLKLSSGGIADIEFMVQYGVLAWSNSFPAELLLYTDNIRLLKEFAQVGKISESEKELLIDAYIRFRQRLHQCRLQGLSGIIDDSEYTKLRAGVTQLWQHWFN